MTGSAADPDFAAQAADRAVQRFGAVHGWVNVAGVTRPTWIEKRAQTHWQLMLDVHVNGSLCFLQAVANHMPGACAAEGVEAKRAKTQDGAVLPTSPGWGPGRRRWHRRRPIFRMLQPTPTLPPRLPERSSAGDQAPGLIVNIFSDTGRRDSLVQIHCAAARFAVFGTTMTAACEWGKAGIRCNAVCISVVQTPVTETVRTDERVRDTHLAQIPLGRWSRPEEAATPVCFLQPEGGPYLTGQVLSVNGGFATAM